MLTLKSFVYVPHTSVPFMAFEEMEKQEIVISLKKFPENSVLRLLLKSRGQCR